MKKLNLLWICLLLNSCCITVPLTLYGEFHQKCSENYAMQGIQSFSWTHYPVNVNAHTSDGIAVDTSNLIVDVYKIDRIIDKVEECVKPYLKRPISRCGFTVKAIDLQEANCPKGWICKGQVQPPNILLVDPEMTALAHELIHLIFNLSEAQHGDERFKCQFF